MKLKKKVGFEIISNKYFPLDSFENKKDKNRTYVDCEYSCDKCCIGKLQFKNTDAKTLLIETECRVLQKREAKRLNIKLNRVKKEIK